MPVSACVKTCGTCVLAGVLSLLYVQGGARTLSGAPDMWTRRCIINYTLAFNTSDPEILSSASVRSF